MNEDTQNSGMNHIRRALGCLIFEAKSYDDAMRSSVWSALLIVFLIGVLAAWANFRYANVLDPQTFPVVRSAATLILVFFLWLVSGLTVHLYSRVFAVKGSLLTIFRVIAYSSLPLLVQQIIRLADSYYTTQTDITLLSQPVSISSIQSVNLFLNSLLSVFTVFGIWTMLLTVKAVRQNYKASYTKSLIITLLTFLTITIIAAIFSAAFPPPS